jgi:hypothetical protein
MEAGFHPGIEIGEYVAMTKNITRMSDVKALSGVKRSGGLEELGERQPEDVGSDRHEITSILTLRFWIRPYG